MISRPNAVGRREETFWATRRIVEAGCPIVRTISGAGLVEGGSFMWIDDCLRGPEARGERAQVREHADDEHDESDL